MTSARRPEGGDVVYLDRVIRVERPAQDHPNARREMQALGRGWKLQFNQIFKFLELAAIGVNPRVRLFCGWPTGVARGCNSSSQPNQPILLPDH